MKLLHHLSFVLRTTNDNEMKKNEFDFVKMKFYLNKIMLDEFAYCKLN
jgi:hypothetical protein